MNNNDKILQRCKELRCRTHSLQKKFVVVSLYSIFVTFVAIVSVIYALPTESKVSNAEAISIEPVETETLVSEKYIATAYCPCKKCCGKTDGITASGAKAVQGVTVAMNKSIPFGTKVYIEGIGERVVQDRGGAIKGNKVDIFFNSHSDALKFGRRTVNLTVIGDK